MNAQTGPQLIHVQGRKTISLDGVWRSIVDPYENGYYDSRRMPVSNGFDKDRDIVDKTLLQEYDFEKDRTIQVPGDWNSQRKELYYYEGTVWYRKRFDYQKQPGKRVFLYFGAANYEAIVFLNGHEIGKHTGGFTPFNIEVTGLIANGLNSLVVKVDNKRLPEAVPTVMTDWWNYGGITRDVLLVETPATFIRDYYVQLKKGTENSITGWVQLDGENHREKTSVLIPELKLRIDLSPDSSGYAAFEVKAKPVLWNPARPKLYAVDLLSGSDTLHDRIGFRTLTTKGHQILLNGQPVFCRGISIHEEAPFRCGRAYSPEDARTLLGWAKEMGCNFVRLAHYPHNENMIRVAEELGLMVWSEIPVYWAVHYTDEATYRNAEAQLSDMIIRDKNRANIIIWSLANETPRNADRFRFISRLAAKARSLDPVRLVAAAMEKTEKRPGVLTVEDDLSAILDVISFNQYVGWYDGLPEKCDRVEWEFREDKPVFISEFGGDAAYGLHGAKNERFTEEFQEELYVKSVAMLKRIPALAGTTPWILMDFRSPRRLLPGIQDDFNRKGLISDQGQKKKAFFVMQQWYEELKKQYAY